MERPRRRFGFPGAPKPEPVEPVVQAKPKSSRAELNRLIALLKPEQQKKLWAIYQVQPVPDSGIKNAIALIERTLAVNAKEQELQAQAKARMAVLQPDAEDLATDQRLNGAVKFSDLAKRAQERAMAPDPKIFLPDRVFGNLYEFQLAFMKNFLPIVAHEMIRRALIDRGASNSEFQVWMKSCGYGLLGVKNETTVGTERWLKIDKDGVTIAVAKIPENLIQ